MKYAINATGVSKPDGYYSQATTCGRFIFISGQTGCRKRAQAHANEEAYARASADALGVREEFAAQIDEISMSLCPAILAFPRLHAHLLWFSLYLLMRSSK